MFSLNFYEVPYHGTENRSGRLIGLIGLYKLINVFRISQPQKIVETTKSNKSCYVLELHKWVTKPNFIYDKDKDFFRL